MAARILFLRSLPLARDARSSKMVAEYRRRGHQVLCAIWSRGEEVASDPDTLVCAARGGYGQRLRGLGARLRWLRFLATEMIRNRRAYDIVHVVDLDTGIIGVPIGRLLGKPVIYDAFDHIAAMTGDGLLGTMLASIERWAIRQSEIGIFPDAIRLEQYGVASGDHIKIIGNIPDMPSPDVQAPFPDSRGPLRLVYIGTLEAEHRGLEYLPDICARFPDRVTVVIGGTGVLHDFFLAAAAQLTNLHYIGHQTYDAALRQMADADCLYGPYLLSAPAHRYASPNKMYEHLALGRPLITNDGTPPAELVRRVGSGFVFDGTLAGVQSLLDGLDREDCRAAGQRALAAWKSEFAATRKSQIDCFFESFDDIAAEHRSR
jgi:glycosyltransferase involved in cell wall biosynthesis